MQIGKEMADNLFRNLKFRKSENVNPTSNPIFSKGLEIR